MVIEMKNQHLSFAHELEMLIYYSTIEIGSRRVDFFVEGKRMLRLKAVTALHDLHFAQALNYLEAYNLPIGLLINFGSRSLEFKRIFKTKHADNKK
ncbi:MAG: GxxExxY protein [Chitinophagales bacterium]|nr:GxxExxY protein [Chitinophagales bacterium]